MSLNCLHDWKISDTRYRRYNGLSCELAGLCPKRCTTKISEGEMLNFRWRQRSVCRISFGFSSEVVMIGISGLEMINVSRRSYRSLLSISVWREWTVLVWLAEAALSCTSNAIVLDSREVIHASFRASVSVRLHSRVVIRASFRVSVSSKLQRI